MAGWFLDIFAEYILRIFFRATTLVRSRRWPVVSATVLSADCPNSAFGCTVATVYYEYTIDGERYGNWFEKPFISQESGTIYAAQFVKGADFQVRVKPDNATKSVPA